jgi:hypothetical protein
VSTYEQIKDGLGYLKLARSGEVFAALIERRPTLGTPGRRFLRPARAAHRLVGRN